MPEGNILVVEDDGSAAKMIMDVLESEGYAVFSASTKAVAVELAGKTKPDLVYINAILADASGLEITRAIREIEELKDVPFVMLTEMQEEFNERYKSTYGIVSFLKKPVVAQDLLSKTMSIVPLEGAEMTGIQDEDEPAVRDAGELAFESFQGEDAVAEPEDRIKIRVGSTDDHEIRDEAIDEALGSEPEDMETGPAEVSEDSEDIFGGADEEVDISTAPEHPLDAGFVESTAYEEESSDDMFGDIETVETGMPGEDEEPSAFEISGNGDTEPGSDMDFGMGDAGDFGSDTGASAEDAPTMAKEMRRPEAGRKAPGRGGLPKVESAKSKIDEMDFDTGSDSSLGITDSFDIEPEKSGKLKFILLGFLGIAVVAAGVWFGLDFFFKGEDKRAQVPVQIKETTDAQKGRAAQVREQVRKEMEARQVKPAEPVPQPGPVAPDVKEKAPEPPKVVTKKAEPVKPEPKQPVAKKRTAPAVKYKYAVQVGFFKESDNARKLYNKMKSKGYEAFIKKDKYKGSTVYRVLVGKYNSRDAARRMMEKIKKVENMDAALHNL